MDNPVDKKSYITPELTVYGNIEEITQGSHTNQASDAFCINGLGNDVVGPTHGSTDEAFNCP